MQVLHELALGVGLKEARLQVELAGETLDLNLELGQGEVAVDVLVAPAEHVEVDAVQDLDPVPGAHHHRPRISSTAARTLSGGSRSPQRGSPGSEIRTKPT